MILKSFKLPTFQKNIPGYFLLFVGGGSGTNEGLASFLLGEGSRAHN